MSHPFCPNSIVLQRLYTGPLGAHIDQQFPLCLKNPIRPMSAGVAKGNLTPQLSILKPHAPSEKGHPWHPADSGLCPDVLPP